MHSECYVALLGLCKIVPYGTLGSERGMLPMVWPRDVIEIMWRIYDNIYIYLTIIARARMAYESISHEAEGRMGY